MPGYRALPEGIRGATADDVRAAEALQREGDLPGAALRLEAALGGCCADDSTPVPGWLCGRLAALYRSLKRYDDEVALLERYEATQKSDEARVRFKARLSKARSIATSKRKQGNGALSSVRQILNAPRGSPRRLVSGSDSGGRSAGGEWQDVPIVEADGREPESIRESRSAHGS